MKEQLYIVWVEGLSARHGEKISAVTPSGFDYTTSLTECLRVKESNVDGFSGRIKYTSW